MARKAMPYDSRPNRARVTLHLNYIHPVVYSYLSIQLYDWYRTDQMHIS